MNEVNRNSSGTNWTQQYGFAIYVTVPEEKHGYECITVPSQTIGESAGFQAWLKRRFSGTPPQKVYFLVRNTDAYQVPTLSYKVASADINEIKEKTRIDIDVRVVTTDSDRVAASFPDDPLRQVVEAMVNEVKRNCEGTNCRDITSLSRFWESSLPRTGNKISDKYQFGMRVDTVLLNVFVPEAEIERQNEENRLEKKKVDKIKELKDKQIEAVFAKKIDDEEIKVETVVNEKKKRQINQEHEQKKLQEENEDMRLIAHEKRISKSKIEIDKKRHHEAMKIKNVESQVESIIQYRTLLLNQLKDGLISHDEFQEMVKFPAGVEQVSGKQLQDSEEVAYLENITEAEYTDSEKPDETEKEIKPWHTIHLSTERLPVTARVFVPPQIKLKRRVEVIVELKKEPTFNDDVNHNLASKWKARMDSHGLLEDKSPVKNFEFSEKENAYRCIFLVSWKRVNPTTAVKFQILDEDEDQIGNVEVKPSRIE
jgi:hypothetical protein